MDESDIRGLAVLLLKLDAVIETQGLTEIVIMADPKDQTYLEACRFTRIEDETLSKMFNYSNTGD